jgi:hypothetical protein
MEHDIIDLQFSGNGRQTVFVDQYILLFQPGGGLSVAQRKMELTFRNWEAVLQSMHGNQGFAGTF